MSSDPFDDYVERMAGRVERAKRRGNIPFPVEFVIAPARTAKSQPATGQDDSRWSGWRGAAQDLYVRNDDGDKVTV